MNETKIDEQKVMAQVADSILDTPVTFDVDQVSFNRFEKLLLKLGMMKKKRSFTIHGSTLGTMVKISKELIAIDMSVYDRENILESNYQMIEKNAMGMARVIAIAVCNSKDDPPESLVSFFLNNLTAKELRKLVNFIIEKIDILNFMHSIILAKGMNLIAKMNPADQRSQVASGVPSVE